MSRTLKMNRTKYRSGATAEIATAISDFPNIGNDELWRYMAHLGLKIEYDSMVTIASTIRTSLNVNLIGTKRRKHVSVTQRAYLRKNTKSQTKRAV